jgi:hypothetical protein
MDSTFVHTTCTCTLYSVVNTCTCIDDKFLLILLLARPSHTYMYTYKENNGREFDMYLNGSCIFQ